MNKLSILLLGLAMTINLVAGQATATTCPNPILTTLGFTPEAAPIDNTAATMCSGLTWSCCSLAAVNGLQTKTDTLLGTLATAAGTRDTLLLTSRAALAAIATDLLAFQAAATLASTQLDTMIAASPAVSGAAEVKAHVDEYSGYVTKLIAEYATLRTGFGTYQTLRQTCVVEIVKVQANAYCLACEADIEDNDVSSTGEITFSDALIAELYTACHPYIVSAVAQNVILKLHTLLDKYEDMTAALILIAAGTESGVAAYNTAIASPDATNKIAELPPSCGAVTCDWIDTVLFPVTGLVEDDLLILGGAEATRRRILEQGRLLQGGWTPVAADSGVTVAFAANPGSVTNQVDSLSSVIRNGVISCIAAVFVTLLV